LKLKRKVFPFIALAVGLTPSLASGQAQQTPIPEEASVAPQIELDGTGIATLESHSPRTVLPSGGRSAGSRINVSDSALLLGASERLYRNGGIGSFVLGATTTESDADPNGTDFFLHQLYLDYQARSFESYLGRTDVGTRLIDFPVLRGDDLNEFTNVQNPYSDGDITEEHRYSNQAAVVFNRKLRYFANVHAQNLIESAPDVTNNGGINSYGVNFQYQTIPALEAMERVPLWGFGYEHQTIGRNLGGANDVLYGGLVYNLAPDPVNRIDLRLQDIYVNGNDASAFANVADTSRAPSNAVAASLRWLHSPFGTPGYQVSLTAGYKTFKSVSDADTYGFALTGVKRLGDGFDLALQFQYQHRQPAYAALHGDARNETSVQLGFVFNFNNTFNPHLGTRRSLMNLKHQYIPD
jgi:hypothetical protein